MPNVPVILKTRQHNHQKHQKSPIGKLGLGCATVLSIGFALSIVCLAFIYADITNDLPPIDSIPQILSPQDGLLYHPTQLLDRSGQHVLLTLENPAATGREYLPLDPNQSKHLSPSLSIATVALSDPDFWNHPGFLWRDVLKLRNPTLAERLVADLLLWGEKPGLRRNLRTCLLASQVTARYGRNQVLEWFLNSANYGQLAYGVDAAARTYFGKSASDINLAEAAQLAAVAEIPALNPIDTPEAAKERLAQTLQTLLSDGLITEEQAAQLKQTPIQFKTGVEPEINPAPAFTQTALKQLARIFGWERLERGGLRIITSLDYDLQLQVSCTTQNHLTALRGEKPVTTTSEATPCEAAHLLPTLTLESEPTSSPTPESISLGIDIVVLEPQSGQVIALESNHPPAWASALDEGRPAGTLLTPFVYLTGLTRGFTSSSLLWDIPTQLPGTMQEVPNLDEQYQGPMRLRNAFANDELAPAVSVLSQVGTDNTWRTSRQIGLVSVGQPTNENAYHVLWEGGQVNLLEITQAFGVFDNQGILAGQESASDNIMVRSDEHLRLGSTMIIKVTDLQGYQWLDWSKPQTRPVISSQLAYMMTNLLSDEAARWRSMGHPNYLEIGRPASAKIGQTLEGRDVWAVGYTPDLVVGVWLGSQDAPDTPALPEAAASALWHAIMQYASRDKPVVGWAMPGGIASVQVCDPSGLLPTKYCPNIVNEIFIEGTEPTRSDNLYRSLEINRETKRLATVFTPRDLIEEQVFMIVPSYAIEWARQTELPLPPENFDTIYSANNLSPDVQLTEPGILATIGGKVTIRGNAAGANFSFYRLQAGKGLNPQQWIQVGEDQTTPVEGGDLTAWDTTGLDGLYVLQLLVIRQDKSVDMATIQVTIDNQSPDINMVYPANGQELVQPGVDKITLQAAVSDNLALDNVSFSVDQELIATLTQEPYAVSWHIQPGQHTLEIKAVDHAGNISVENINFNVTP